MDLLKTLVRDALAQRRRTGKLYPYAHPQMTAVVLYRVARWLYLHHLKPAAYLLLSAAQTLTGAELWPEADIGPGFCIVHTGGVVIGPVTAGERLTVFAGVTLGATGFDSRSGRPPGWPTIGDDVTVYTKATIMGAVNVGDNAIVGAHALVTNDVPAGHVAKGTPARSTPRG